jgi:hypothetical protein
MLKALQIRLTHKYVGTYQHEDEWETLGEYEVLSSQKWKPIDDEEFDPTDTIKKFYEVVVRTYGSEHKVEQITQALRDQFTKVGCHHDYDCCGCRSYYAEKPEFLYQEEDGLHYRLIVNSYRNY